MSAVLLTVAEAARVIRKDRHVVARWIANGTIPETVAVVDPESQRVFVRAAALDRWLEGAL